MQSENNEIDHHCDDKWQQQEAKAVELSDELNLNDKEEGNNENEDDMAADESNTNYELCSV